MSDRDEIEQAHVDFYTKLFSVEDIDEDCHDLLLTRFRLFYLILTVLSVRDLSPSQSSLLP